MSMKELMLNKTWLFGFVSLFSSMPLVPLTGTDTPTYYCHWSIFCSSSYDWSLPHSRYRLIWPCCNCICFMPRTREAHLGWVSFVGAIQTNRFDTNRYLGIFIMTVAVFFLGLSDLQIDTSKTDFLGPWFVLRVGIFSLIIILICISCKMWSWRKDKNEGTVLALLSGSCVSFPCSFYGRQFFDMSR